MPAAKQRTVSEIPDDAYQLLSEEAVEHWLRSGELCCEDCPDTVLKEWAQELRAEGQSELEIACAIVRIDRLVREEELGLIERVPTPDGGALFVGRDPFEGLPLTE